MLVAAGEEVADLSDKVNDLSLSSVAFKVVFSIRSNELAHRAGLAGLSRLGHGRAEAQEHGDDNESSAHLKCVFVYKLFNNKATTACLFLLGSAALLLARALSLRIFRRPFTSGRDLF